MSQLICLLVTNHTLIRYVSGTHVCAKPVGKTHSLLLLGIHGTGENIYECVSSISDIGNSTRSVEYSTLHTLL